MLMERTFGSGDRKRVWRGIWICCLLWSAQFSTALAETGYGSYTPNHISADQAWRLIKKTNIGTVSPMPNANCLLITGTRHQRSVLLGVLDLVDTSHTYEVTVLKVDEIHWNESIPQELGEIYTELSIGTLIEPAAKGSGIRIMIDRIDDRVLVIAPSNWTQRIVTALTQGLDEAKSKQVSLTNEAILRQSPEPKTLFRGDTGRITQTQGLANTQAVDSESEARPTRPPVGNSPLNQGITPVPSGASHINEYQSPQAPNAEDTLDLSLPEKVSIVDLLDLVGKYLGLTFMYDPDTVTGDVTLKLEGELEGPLKVKQLYPLLESVLKFRGYVMARRGNVVTVERAENWADVDPDLRSDGGLIDFGEAVITRPFKLKHISTEDAESLLESMKLGLSKSTVAATKTLIITEYSYRMPRIEALLELVDQPGDPRVFRSRRLQYTMARNLTDKVQALAEQLSNIEISVTAEETEPSIPSRRPNETQAQYNRRVALARQAAARRAAANRRSSQAGSETTSRDSVYLDADERTNSILMIGREEQLVIVMDLIDTLDVEQQDPRTPKLYEIEFVDAEEVRNKLQELGVISGYTEPRNDVSGRITGQAQSDDNNATSAAARQRSSTQTTMDNLAGESLLEEPQVVVIEQTNSLLINATAEQHVQISGLLKYIDADTRSEAIPYTIYALKNQDPEEMATILQQLIEETITDPEGKVERVVRKIDDEIVIVPDQTTYSLIVYASNRNQKWIENLIAHLDKRRPQVLIDVTLVEISETDEFDYDLNVLESFPDLTSTSGLTDALTTSSTGQVIKSSSDIINALADSGRDRFVDFQSNSGSGTAFYGDRHINALLTAMQTKNYGRVLAKPKILVNDNEPGTISTKDTTYVKTTSSTIPTQGSTAIPTGEKYDPYDAGITLEITPHISEGDLLKLEIALNRSDFTAEPTADRPPNTNSSDLNTIVTVPDKSTIILGGMLKLNQNKSTSKVPLLGDIPLVGGLFRGAGNSDIQKKLYVFVKAEIIRPTDVTNEENALVKISDRNRSAFERHEAKFQEYQGWPGLKSKVMSPEKVLEAD